MEDAVHFVVSEDGKTRRRPPFPSRPYWRFDYELDEFQQVGIACVHAGESVLAAAHTSAGKTAIAIYAIAAGLLQKKRVIYTSPIKALTNQKYDEFRRMFGDAGLMTGDVTINSEGKLLLMTTEVLLELAYRDAAVLGDLAWVVFDEIHYMRDPERGRVWEECITMINSNFVFLSATIPNALEFAEWVARRGRICHVVCTSRRIIPLQLYLAPYGGNDIYKIREGDGPVETGPWETAFSQIQPIAAKGGKNARRDKQRDVDVIAELASHTSRIVALAEQKDWMPMIIFSFSRAACNELHKALEGRDFAGDDRRFIRDIFAGTVGRIPLEDRMLPQIEMLRGLVERGIGLHHGGMIPVLKEVVEVLFREGFIKVLFATETLALGVDMPARAVVFHEVVKFDGQEERPLNPGEFTQMSGRAGRRGFDSSGVVIVEIAESVSPESLMRMVTEPPPALQSTYRVTPSMVLNTVQREVDPIVMIRRSFQTFQRQQESQRLKDEEVQLQARVASIPVRDGLKQAYEKEEERSTLKRTIRECQAADLVNYVVPGQVVVVDVLGLAVVVLVDLPRLAVVGMNAHTSWITLEAIESVSTTVVRAFEQIALTPPEDVVRVMHHIVSSGVQLVDPYALVRERRREWNVAMARLKELGEPDAAPEELATYGTRLNLQRQIACGQVKIAELDRGVAGGDVGPVVELLKQVGFVDGRALTMGGRLAALVKGGHEVLVAELVLDQTLVEADDAQTAAIFAVLTGDGKRKIDLPACFGALGPRVEAAVRKVAGAFATCVKGFDPLRYFEELGWYAASMAAEWAAGYPFGVVTKNSGLEDGVAIRVLKRMGELMTEVADAVDLVVKDAVTASKIRRVARMVLRGIVICPSLYHNDE